MHVQCSVDNRSEKGRKIWWIVINSGREIVFVVHDCFFLSILMGRGIALPSHSNRRIRLKIPTLMLLGSRHLLW